MELRDERIASPAEAQLSSEDQIAFLKRSNIALRRSVERFAESGRFDSLLEAALLEAMSVMGAAGGSITIWDQGHYPRTKCVAQDGLMLPREEWEADPFFQEIPTVISKDPDGFTSRLLSAPYTRESLEWAKQFWPAAANFHARHGHVEAWNVPCVVKGELVATLGLAFREPRDGSPALIENLTALAQQMGLMIEMSRLAAEAQESAKERERTAGLARANAALQATIDALGESRNLDRIVPRVLEIVAETFHAASCAVFENDHSGRVWLRYWSVEGRTLTPDELMGLDLEKFGLVRQLAEGFEAPDMYLGIPTNMVGTTVLDHVRGTAVPEFDKFAIGTGWELELNIGVGAGGIRATTLCIYRGRANPFTLPEVALAESLATQLGLAVQFAKLAEEAKQVAVAGERERAAVTRAEGLAKISEASQATLARLAEQPDIDAFLGHVLAIGAEQFGAAGGGVWVQQSGRGPRLLLTLENGKLITGEQMDHPGREAGSDDRIDDTPAMLRGEIVVYGWNEICTLPHLMPYREWLIRNRIRTLMMVPMFLGESYRGALSLRFTTDCHLNRDELELAHSLANQAVLALEITRLADEARKVAVAREREIAAELRVAELGRANRALKAAVDSLATARSGPMLLQGILGVLRDTMEAVSVGLAVRDRQLLAAITRGNSSLEAEIAEPGLVEYLVQGRPEFAALSQCNVLSPKAEESFQKQGVKGQLTVPLVLGDELIGALKIRLKVDKVPPQEQVELAQSLAHQGTLAIRLTELAIEAQQEAAAKAASEERAALARELHDTLLQSFTGITLQLRAMGRRSGLDESSLALLASIEQQATEAVQSARRAVSGIRVPERIELSKALRSMIETERAQSPSRLAGNRSSPDSVDFQFSESGKAPELAAFVAKDLLRIAQEALHNAVHHSSASTVRISLSCRDETVRILLEDNGCGFNLEEALARPDSFGIAGMRERARQIRATLDISPRPAGGTAVLIEYPAMEIPVVKGDS